MDRDPWPSTYDRELDVPSRPPIGRREPIDRYRRLVANPLPAVACGLVAILLLRSSLQSRNLAAFLVSVGMLVASLFFTQFHCLDCGKTTWLFAARRHACAPALARWREGRTGRWPFPGLKLQMIVWLHVIVSVSVLLLILLASGR